MNVVSVFAGIGGFDLGFERAGFEIVAHVEKDQQCRDLLKSKWPDTILLDDACTAGAHNLPQCDVICAGWPCQDLSVAGKRAGLVNGSRSNLFYELTRLIRELRPRYFLGENVPGLLSSDSKRDFARVLGELGKCGARDIAWRVLDAQYFGLAQRRKRVLIVADFGGECASEILSLQEGMRRDPPPGREARETVAGTLGGSSQSGGFRTTDLDNSGAFIPVAGPLNQSARRATGFNAQDENLIAGCVSSKWAKGTGGPAGDECYNLVAFDTTQLTNPENRCNPEPGDPCHPLSAQAHAPAVAFRAAGQDGFTPSDVAPPIVSTAGGGAGAPAALIRSAVRRLTPRECERLQGFPDDWTAGFSDSTRYKMLGNAVAVPVVEWIARRILSRS